MIKIRIASGIVGILGSLWATQTFAHHAMGGDMPLNMVQGLLSGLAHPVIGIDHLAFLIAMGIAAAFTPRAWSAPLAFVAATLIGCLLVVAGLSLPGIEFGVALSVVLVGGLVVSGRALSTATIVGLFSVAGLLHGMAYAGAIVGAQTSPLVAYLVGFAGIQYAIAITAGALARRGADTNGATSLRPRLAGAIAAGVGIAILVENLEGLLVAA